MRKMDECAVKMLDISYMELMEKAAESAFDCICEYIKNINFTKPDFQNILILCGTGNNGGDGYVLGRLFAENAEAIKSVTVINISDIPAKSEAALFHYTKLKGSKNSNNIKILFCPELSDENLQKNFSDSDIIIDAVFGTGFKGHLDGEALRVIKFANKITGDKLRIAIDVPSGVDCDSGKTSANSFKADLTVTFEFIKRGLVSYPGAEYAGETAVVPIGFNRHIREMINKHSILLSPDYIKNIFDNRDNRKSKNTNKGDFGRLLAICGSKNMTGAAYFASMKQ
jgi:NAD(P)H-hydrate epimerase